MLWFLLIIIVIILLVVDMATGYDTSGARLVLLPIIAFLGLWRDRRRIAHFLRTKIIKRS